jgi:hypothetical protein
MTKSGNLILSNIKKGETRPAVVVLAFNRPKALLRLLNCLDHSHIPSEATLILSVEGGADPEVLKIVKEYKSSKCIVEKNFSKERLGLRKHVLRCANNALKFGAVIVLEDDLIIDPYFYQYSVQAVDYYRGYDCIAGISLYSYEFNEFSKLPFTPMANGYSTYIMQVVSSWGQCWTDKQWLSFLEWYNKNSESDISEIDGLPPEVASWPESSWKKYYQSYLISNKRFFVFPYLSLSSNCSDHGGTHIKKQYNFHQVSLGSPNRCPPDFRFCPPNDTEVLYDAYMEPCGEFVYRSLGINSRDVAIDIQGIKLGELLKKKKYTLTSRPSKNGLVSYPWRFLPPEANIRYPLPYNRKSVLNLVETQNLVSESRKFWLPIFLSLYTRFDLASLKFIFGVIVLFPKSLFIKCSWIICWFKRRWSR